MEILIAIFIVAIMSVIMIRGLQTVVSAKDNISRNADRLANVTLAMSLLESDLQNVINRPITDASGVSQAPVLLNDDAWQTLDLTRAGVANPLAQ
jgi:type II secretion system protein J